MGGLESSICFDEVRRCYLDGSDLAVVLLCLAYVERELAAQLYAAGWEPAKQAPLRAVLEKAHKDEWLSAEEWRAYGDLAKLRNSDAHFRATPERDDANGTWRARARATERDTRDGRETSHRGDSSVRQTTVGPACRTGTSRFVGVVWGSRSHTIAGGRLRLGADVRPTMGRDSR